VHRPAPPPPAIDAETNLVFKEYATLQAKENARLRAAALKTQANHQTQVRHQTQHIQPGPRPGRNRRRNHSNRSTPYPVNQSAEYPPQTPSFAGPPIQLPPIELIDEKTDEDTNMEDADMIEPTNEALPESVPEPNSQSVSDPTSGPIPESTTAPVELQTQAASIPIDFQPQTIPLTPADVETFMAIINLPTPQLNNKLSPVPTSTSTTPPKEIQA
jgi:hypothetical protein